MAVIINTNVDSIKIRHDLNDATNKLSTSMQRMSTGLKVLTAKDDAAGTVIAARMNVQLNGNKIAQKNIQNGSALLTTSEGYLDVIEDNLSRIRDLTLQAKNGTYSKEEISAMQDEVKERIAEIDRVSDAAKYSQLQLFGETKDGKGTEEIGLAKNGITFQVGTNADDYNIIKVSANLFKSVKFEDLTGVDNASTEFDLNKMYETANKDTPAEKDLTFDQAVADLDDAIDDVTGRKSLIGSASNRLESALETLTIQEENLNSAKSIITDADIAEEASSFTQQQILQQVSTALLAQANQAPAIALSLIDVG